MARYHYLGCKRPFGSHLRYFITDVTGRDLGCLMFEDSTKTLPCRDRWIGWTDYQRSRFRHLTVCNSRFLIFPWVRVKYLASMALGMAARQLGDDWLRIHGYRIILAETYVEEPRFKGTCYLAANWMRVGRTRQAIRQGPEDRAAARTGPELQGHSLWQKALSRQQKVG